VPEKIRIAHIVEATAGGTRRHVYDLIAHSDFSKYEVTLICATRRDVEFLQDIELLRSLGARVKIVEMVRSIHPVGDLRALLGLCRVLRRLQPTLVHTHSSKAGFLGRAAARLVGVPVTIHTPHVFAFEMQVGPLMKRLYMELERFAACLTDRIICVSESERNLAKAARLISTEKLRVVRNGIDMPAVSPDVTIREACRKDLDIGDSEIVIGTLGRFYEQKGLEILLAAAEGILKEDPSSRIIIAAGEGDPRVKRRITKMLDGGGLSGRCKITDPPEEASHFLAALDIFVLPSLWEGLPYVLLEAMATGLPVVASHVGGVPELLRDGKEGVLIPVGDVQALKVAVCRLAADREYAVELGCNGAKRVRERFSMGEMLRKTFKVYDDVLDEKGLNPLQ